MRFGGQRFGDLPRSQRWAGHHRSGRTTSDRTAKPMPVRGTGAVAQTSAPVPRGRTASVRVAIRSERATRSVHPPARDLMDDVAGEAAAREGVVDDVGAMVPTTFTCGSPA